MMLNVTQEAIDMAWSEKSQDPASECLLATAAKLQFGTNDVDCGFTTIGIDGKNYTISPEGAALAHRWVWERGLDDVSPPRPTQVELTPMDE